MSVLREEWFMPLIQMFKVKMMESKLSTEDKKRIVEGIRKKYAEASVTPQGLFNYPTGRDGLEGLGYDPKIVESIPRPVIDSFCGVGNPFSLGPIHEGETVLDIGCGGGFDVIFVAIMVGSSIIKTMGTTSLAPSGGKAD